MQLLYANRYATTPWRNGGGSTREVAVCPDPAGHEDFLWRISIATIADPGPFSRFEGMDRTIAVLSGEGIYLQMPAARLRLDGETAPFSFAGDLPVTCALIGGTTIDLNVMSRSSLYRHTMRRERFTGRWSYVASADTTIIVSNADLDLSWHARKALGPLDAIVDIAPGTVVDLYAGRPAEIFVIELFDRR